MPLPTPENVNNTPQVPDPLKIAKAMGMDTFNGIVDANDISVKLPCGCCIIFVVREGPTPANAFKTVHIKQRRFAVNLTISECGPHKGVVGNPPKTAEARRLIMRWAWLLHGVSDALSNMARK